MAIHLQRPAEFRRNGLREIDDGHGELIHGAEPFRRQRRAAGRKQHFGFEHEPVANDADVLAVLQEFAQPAEEVGPVALQLLHLARERRVEPRAEILDAVLTVLVLRSRTLRSASLSAASCRRSASICWLSRSTLARASLEMFFCASRSADERLDAPFGRLRLFVAGECKAGELVLLRLEVGSVACSAASSSAADARLALLERQQVCEFRDLPREPGQRRVLAARFLGGVDTARP